MSTSCQHQTAYIIPHYSLHTAVPVLSNTRTHALGNPSTAHTPAAPEGNGAAVLATHRESSNDPRGRARRCFHARRSSLASPAQPWVPPRPTPCTSHSACSCDARRSPRSSPRTKERALSSDETRSVARPSATAATGVEQTEPPAVCASDAALMAGARRTGHAGRRSFAISAAGSASRPTRAMPASTLHAQHFCR